MDCKLEQKPGFQDLEDFDNLTDFDYCKKYQKQCLKQSAFKMGDTGFLLCVSQVTSTGLS